ncbi:hypothetical protein EDC96DRAFT_563874 [Choanephora cucurbitarum]|nr:hypothetical protein EDC96DRAFT_563874 [Choanephora cucurbitarum]
MTTLQVYAHRLSDPNLAPGLKVTIANELRDQVEIFQTLEYSRFLATLIPVFVDILQNGNPVFQSNVPEQKLRNIILEIIYRLPQTETLKEYAPDLCRMLIHLLKVENEDNAVVCVKIIIDLHRTFRTVLEDQVQPFLDIVQEIFKNMEQTVKDVFDAPSTPIGSATPGINPLLATSPRPNSPAAAELPESPSKPLSKSMFSFKVLTECPIIVVLLFQTHRRYATENIMKFVPLIFQTLSLQAKPQAEAAQAAQARGEVFVGVSPEIRNRSVYNDFIVAQVKTISFLAYILRSYTTFLRPFQNQIPDFVLRLLRECPPESSATRKELLVATRHILSTDFRSSFVPKIDLLLNEKVLIGTGVTSHDTLRPLAYSMLADLVHHIRSELSPSQLYRTVYIYSRNLHDATLAPSIQTMCGKLLLNLIDCIIKTPNKKDGRDLLMRILDAFASKFSALNIQFKACSRCYIKKQADQPEDATMTEEGEEGFDFEKARSIQTAAFSMDSQQDGIKDGRFLFKNLAIGLKPLFIGLRHCNPPTSPGLPMMDAVNMQFARGFSQEDVRIFSRLFREGLQCFEYYNVDHYGPNGALPHEAWKKKENEEGSIGCNDQSLKVGTQVGVEKEILEMFAVVFTLLDPAVFQEIFVSQMDFFFDCMLVNTSLVHIAQFFLVNEISSQGFAGILFKFLMDRMDRLGEDDVHYSAVLLHLFRLAFMAVNLLPDANEPVLQPYLGQLVNACFKLSSKAKEPANYFLLLRSLFKSIGGGRFELLYKEVTPLLQVLLENLNSLLILAHRAEMRNLFVELCLAVPVRLSTLLPYLPYLMRPLVIALQGEQELVAQGLRTLELCNDNLNPEFLDQIMSPVMDELMAALWSHLRPLPYSQLYSHVALRILGKLGGRNRRMLGQSLNLEYKKEIESGVSVEIIFDPNSTPHTLPLDQCLDVACKTLDNQHADLFYKKHAYEFLKANIIMMLELDEGAQDLAGSLFRRVKNYLLQPESEKDLQDDDEDDGQAKQRKEEEKEAKLESTEMEVDELNGEISSKAENVIVGDSFVESGLQPKRLAGNGYTKYLSKRVAQERSLKVILVAIIKASTMPELAEDAWPFFEDICRHFMLLHIGEAIDAKETDNKPLSDMMDERLSVQNLSTTILVDAVVEVICSEDPKLRARAEESLQICFSTATDIFDGKDYIWQLPIFRVFASQFGSCCYKQEWFNKRGGCLGISIISSQLDMGIKWMREHELDFIRSLLFVLKDSSPEMANINTTEATQTLSHVLKVCNRPEDDEAPEVQKKFQNLIALLLSELSNSNSIVRETIQSSFQLLADLTGNEVTELLAPVRERLVAPIFAKPLRALPFAMQIGHIDAITYCLTLRPPFLEFNDELIRLLHEALALADAEDQALVSRSSQYKNATSLMNLRIVCIRLLSAAMACPDFPNQRQAHTRARIIQVFFKSLYSKAPEVVEAAHRGLKQVLAQQHKLPKEILQQGLRPILTTLANHKTLSIAGLEGLARLLELLTNYFKVEIGKKLLDHLKLWAEPKVLQDAASKNLSENHDVKIIVAILNIFHLLPPSAHIFLDNLVTVVLEMESHLRRSISSPFRPNLIKYLNRYPTETLAYFYERLDQSDHAQLFIDVLATESAEQIRNEVMKSPKDLIEKTLNLSGNSSAHYQGVLVIYEIAKYDPHWLTQHPELLESLLNLWRSPQRFETMKKDDEQGYQMTRQSLCISHVFIAYLRVHPDNVDIIFELASLFAQESVMDLSYLREFFLSDFAMSFSAKIKRAVLERFLQQFNDTTISAFLRMMMLRHVINPSLLVSITRKDSTSIILDSSMVEQLNQKLWSQLSTDASDEDQYVEDSLRIELLQMTAMIVQYASHLLTDLRKEIIKFGWHYLRLEDASCKQAAYVLIARFISAFETPSKIVIQIYAALLRAHLSEARVLVKQGLDILAPVLPKRVPLLNNERVPTWVRLTRKVIVEDTHSISQMINVYQLLVRQPDLFYDYREHFLPQIVNALPKLGLLQNATPENKLLTVELSELLLKWEQHRLQNQAKMESSASSPAKRCAEDTPATPTKKSKSEGADGELKTTATKGSGQEAVSKEYVPPLTLRENTIGYLVRLACTVYNPSDMIQRKLVQRVLELIKRFLEPTVWSDVHVKFAHLERTLTVKEMNEILVASVCSALEILCIDITHKPVEWFIVNMSQLFRLLENSIKSDNTRVHTALQPVLSIIFGAINQTTNSEKSEELQHPDVAAFVSLVESTITDGMASMNNIYVVLKLLQASSTNRSEQLDPFVGGIVKLLQKLTKEHIISAHTASSTSQDSQVNLLTLCLNLLKKRISHLGDQRRWLLSCLTQLIEKSPDVQLLHTILDMVSEWTLDRKETFPTVREKAGLLVKMMTFEARSDTKLLEDFLELVIKIYSDPSFARSELTVRLEQAFLLGARNENPNIRSQFMRIFDKSTSRNLYTRLDYILGVQNWESLSNTFWIHQALDMLLGSIKANTQITSPQTLKIKSIETITGSREEPIEEVDVPKKLNQLVQKHQTFLKNLQNSDINNSILSARYLQYLDAETAFKLWVDLFPMCWISISSAERNDMTKVLINLLAKDYHNKQAEMRPNVVQALLAGIAKTNCDIKLPPHLVKYLGKTFNAWHTAIDILQRLSVNRNVTESPKHDLNNHERTMDALAELYSSLKEDDMFYGLWRRRSTYTETNVAVSYEQCGMWAKAQTMYENAQIKARSGVLPFTESEYMLWEDHWISCTQKLQQWDILADLAKHDGNSQLLIECAWRLSDWATERESLEQTINSIPDIQTPRLKAMKGFLALIKSQALDDRLAEFTRVCEEGLQMSLHNWHSLPPVVSQSHMDLLIVFQQYLELHEASQIFMILANTNAQTLEQQSTNLRSILGTWRERLPNAWDDINVWSDIVAWRQHVFNAINRVCLPLLPVVPNPMNMINSQANTAAAYRGYHETAWIINQFGHIARKHHLPDVCISQLTKIYTLPNIEIQEAYTKLREQAKCYYKNPAELTAGLDLINNTNLGYFSPQQKAEFFTLKGQFLAKLNHNNEANEAFVNAVQIDLSLPRAWAEWGKYNDGRFKENPHDLSYANNAVSCYLQAAGIYKNAKARKYFLRVLWLLSLDDANGTISRAFEGYKGEWPVWYWVTFIPQLLMSLQQTEGKHARAILIRIAKQFPQALHFQLRTAKEDMMKRTNAAAAAAKASNANTDLTQEPKTKNTDSTGNENENKPVSNVESSDTTQKSQEKSEDKANNKDDMEVDSSGQQAVVESGDKDTGDSNGDMPVKLEEGPDGKEDNPSSKTSDENANEANSNEIKPSPSSATTPTASNSSTTPTHPLDEIMAMLKTGYPLLALSMETMVDQIQLKFKPQADEDMYRLVVALYNEGAQQLLSRLMNPKDNLELTGSTIHNIARFAGSLYPGHMKTAFVHDFATTKLNLEEYVAKLRLWRDKFEAMLDARPRKQKLEACSHYLVEFQHQKFDDVEIPGQYLLLKDNANDFLRIDRFLPEIEVVRSYGNCFRRLTIRGHDGTLHPFVIQNPAARQFRREERLVQLFRILNEVLGHNKDSRQRNLKFHLPAIVPLAPNVRMVQDDLSYCTLYDIYEDHCDAVNIHKDEPLIFFIEKIKSGINKESDLSTLKTELLNLRMEINEEITKKYVPSNILSKYMLRTLDSYTEYWSHRKQFISQYAAATFASYLFSIGNRTPHKMTVSRQQGDLWMTELLPGWLQASNTEPMLGNGESVPFRFTPNVQEYITPVGIEGPFTSCLMSIARSLVDPELDLEEYLSLFVRDELATWYMSNHIPIKDTQVRNQIQSNVGQIIAKARFLSCSNDNEKVIVNFERYQLVSNSLSYCQTVHTDKPVNQNIIDLISQASNPQKLAQMECTWMSWL